MIFSQLAMFFEDAPKTQDFTLLIVIGVLFVGMIVMQVFSRKKSKKKAEEMHNQVVVGAKVMTVGGIIGKIVFLNDTDNTFTLTTGPQDMQMTFTKNAIHSVINETEPQPQNPIV